MRVSIASQLLTEQLEIPYTTRDVLIEMRRVLDMSVIQFDEGEGAFTGKLPRQLGSEETLKMPPPLGSDSLTWFPESEPPMVPTDTWARTVVEARARVKKPRLNDLPRDQPDSETARSATSRMSGSTNRNKSRGGSRPGSTAKVEEPVVVVEVSNPADKNDGLTKAEQEYLLNMKLEAQRKKLADEQGARDAAKLKKEKEIWDKRIADLKGKKHTFDANGDIIVIDPIKPEKLPSSSVNMNIKISDESPGAGRRSRNGRGVPTPGSSKGRNKSPIKKAGKEYFTVSATLQPPIFEVTNIGSGVSINAGGVGRSGSSVEDVAPKMSRSSYQHLRGNAAGVDDTTAITGLESQNDMSNLTFDDTYTLGDEVSEAAANMPEPEPASPAAEEVSIQGGRRRKQDTPQEEDVEDDILKLAQAPDWGQVGGVTKEPVVPRLPMKPGVKVKAATASPRPKFPRDRLPVEATKFTADMTKLSAPGLGESTGHGMPINGTRKNENMSQALPHSKNDSKAMFPAIDSARQSIAGDSVVTTQSPEAKRMLGLR